MGTKILSGTDKRDREYDDGGNQGNAKTISPFRRGKHDTKKNDRYIHAKVSEKVEIIKELSAKYDVNWPCQIFGVPRSSYYAVLNRTPSKRSIENEGLKEKILKIYIASKRRYGCIKITRQLERNGVKVGQNRVLRLTRQLNIQSIVCKKYRKRSRETDNTERSNLLNRRFYADRPNQIWLTDITYIKTIRHGWTYLAAVLDICTRKVVGYSYSKGMNAELTCDAIRKACRNQGYPKNVLLHSDRGSQYISHDFIRVAKSLNICLSYSAKACPFDNAPMEAFNSILKKEEVYLSSYADFDSACPKIFDFIERFYNRNRIHSSIGFLTPVEFENQFVNF